MIGMTATQAKGKLEPKELNLPPLKRDEVEIGVEYCGVCHSDLSILDNEWGISSYPFIPGHEVIGTVRAVGDAVLRIKPGDRVGLGWFSRSCLHCDQCMSGDHNLCQQNEGTMLGRPGGFATHVRCQESWAIPLPKDLDPKKAGPLFCGGITVFNPIVQCGVKPTDRVGVIGIGGLGHLALQFLNAWGCEVIAFSSSDGKSEEAKKLGAHQVVNSKDKDALGKIQGSLNFILSTVNASMNWDAFLATLAPKGRLHVVGAVPEPIPVPAFTLLSGQKSVSGTPLGAPATTARMLEFCGRHKIETVTEHFPMSKANDAIERLRSGKARYRIVLENDLQ